MWSIHRIWDEYRASVLAFGIKSLPKYVEPAGIGLTDESQFRLLGSTFLVAKDVPRSLALYATAYHVFKSGEDERATGGGERVGHVLVEDGRPSSPPERPPSASATFHGGFTTSHTGKAENEKDFAVYEFALLDDQRGRRMQPIPLSRDVRIGDPVVALGYQHVGLTEDQLDRKRDVRLFQSVVTGHVSAIVGGLRSRQIQFDNYGGPGHSGAPLINCRTGMAVGIVIENLEFGGHRTNLSIAVSVIELVPFMEYFPGLLVVR